MNEEQIAAKVAQNIPHDDPTPIPKPEVDVPDPNEPIDHTHLDYEDPVLNARLSDYFELPRTAKYTEETQRQLRTVLDWANQFSDGTEVADLLLMIQRTERELGILYKPNRLERMYRFVRIQQQTLGLDKELELLRG